MINENAVCLPVKFLPDINWFASATEKSEVIFSSKEFYRKENHPNRFSILSANGVIDLSIPLAGGRNQRVILSELKIAGSDWKKKQLHAIQSAYGKAPYFLYYFDALENIILNADSNFSELCISTIKWLCLELTSVAFFSVTDEKMPAATSVLSDEKKYHQVFENKFGFQQNLSAIDLLFCLGPDAKKYLSKMNLK